MDFTAVQNAMTSPVPNQQNVKLENIQHLNDDFVMDSLIVSTEKMKNSKSSNLEPPILFVRGRNRLGIELSRPGMVFRPETHIP